VITPYASLEVLEAIASTVAVIVANIDTGEIVYASKQAELLFGYKITGSLLGKTVEELMAGKSREKHVGFRKEFVKNPEPRIMGNRQQLYGLRQDGTEIALDIALAGHMVGGKACGVLTFYETTEKRK